MKGVWIILSVFLLHSCGDKAFEKYEDISYRRGGNGCEDAIKNHWLLDITAQNSKDSTYLNTKELKRKVEVQRIQLDTSSSLVHLLSKTCKDDSIELRLKASEFYLSLNGRVPSHLTQDEQIKVKVNMRDKLSDIEHIAYKKLFESQAIAEYVEQNRWNADRDSMTQIYFEKLKSTKKSVPEYTKVAVEYTIKTLNDQLIYRSKEGEPFIYDSQDKGVISGIRYMIERLAEGESARAVIPSHHAYGADGNQRIPGYMPVVIELNVLNAVEN
ncbi:MAG: FKBP-type peptidyl-prolyl cis-trans isomerase [Bacteroidia bacterium]